MPVSQDFSDHLGSGATTLARCWKLTRSDGWARGFTDHDADVTFDGVTFSAGSGLSAQAMTQTTGLSIDNTEALGALSAAMISEADIEAGRFDGAEVEAWLVNWADPRQRHLQFRGRLGEITRAGGAFRAELLGLSDALNTPQGRVYQTACSAVLGDRRCGVDTTDPAFRLEAGVLSSEGARAFVLDAGADFSPDWFARGRVTVLDGPAKGLAGVVRVDTRLAGGRKIELWQGLRAEVPAGTRLRVEAGCDKHADTCRDRFANIVNFRGFPHIPGEDRLLSVPVREGNAFLFPGGAK